MFPFAPQSVFRLSGFLAGVFAVSLSIVSAPANAAWTPYSAVTAGVTGTRVSFSVADPLRPGWAPASAVSIVVSPAPTNLTVVDGVVAWVQGSAVRYAIYDGRSGFWKESFSNFSGTIVSLINRDGVVAWVQESVGGTQTVVGRVYVPGYTDQAGFWRPFNASANSMEPGDLYNEDGVVAWVSGAVNPSVSVRIYNMAGRFWHVGGSTATPSGPLTITDGTVLWDTTVGPRKLGYNGVNPAASFWTTQIFTQPVSYFFATPSSGDGPLAVAFWDLSIGRTSGTLAFGDGGSSGAEGAFNTYTGFGEFTATFTVDNPQLNTPSHMSSRVINVTGAPPTATPTDTTIPPSPTNTTVPVTATFTPTSPAPTATFTPTVPVPTATFTPTVPGPTATFTPTQPGPTSTSTPIPTATNTSQTPPTATNTPIGQASPTPTTLVSLTPQILLEILEALRDNPHGLEEILNIIRMWGMPTATPIATLGPPTSTPTSTATSAGPTATTVPTQDPDQAIFQAGDALVTFDVFPDGSPIDGVDNVPVSFTPGTHLVDQFSSVGVRFQSTSFFGSAVPAGVGAGVISGPCCNQVQGLRSIPPGGLDARTVWEIQFDTPVERAGVRRTGFVVLGTGKTKFYDTNGALLASKASDFVGDFVSHQVAAGSNGIARMEITADNPNDGAGAADNLMFSQVGGLLIPAVIQYAP